jgi:DNA polymerase-3 subunit alpha
MRLNPENIEDLIAVISLYRPGPMDSIPTYIRNRHDPTKVTYKHPLLKGILDVTYGCIVYQEQVMQIFRTLAGYSYGRADIVRRAMAKKKHTVLENERKSFVYGDNECDGAVKRGVPENIANEIFDEMTSFASYAFNKSHAAAYATISYQTAYLKCHFYKEYMAALMTVTLFEKPHKLYDYINDVTHSGLKILPLDINKSSGGFKAEKDGIRFALLAVKGVGESLINSLEREREINGKFVSFENLCTRMADSGMNLKTCEALIKSGALDSLPNNRHEMLSAAGQVIKQAQQTARINIEGQLDFFAMSEETANPENALIPKMPEYDRQLLLDMEYEVTGMYLSGHPLDEYQPFADADNCTYASAFSDSENKSAFADGQMTGMVLRLTEKRPYRTKNGTLMCFAQGEDKSGTAEFIVFPSVFETAQSLMKDGNILHIFGKVSLKDGESPKLIADVVETGTRYLQECKNKDICVRAVSTDSVLLDKIRSIAQKYADNSGRSLVIYLADKRVSIRLKSVCGVRIEGTLIAELQSVAGAENVKFMKRK